MIKNVFQLKDITAEDAMTPRIYVFALDGNLQLKEAQELLFQSKYSRIPVYDGTLDNITGVLYKTKALTELAKDRSDVRLRDIAHPPLFVPNNFAYQFVSCSNQRPILSGGRIFGELFPLFPCPIFQETTFISTRGWFNCKISLTMNLYEGDVGSNVRGGRWFKCKISLTMNLVGYNLGSCQDSRDWMRPGHCIT